MKLSIKGKNAEGEVAFEGVIAGPELSFLVQYAVNDLMQAGMEFIMGEADEDGDRQLKFDYGEHGAN